ncbi:MAG: aspartate/glutamate racemase family protein [Erysipelotrichaceae bacterium]|jgi:hypothetical protein
MKKVVMIHTSPVSLTELKNLVKEIVPEVELVNIIDDSLLEEVKSNGNITPGIISRMMSYVQCADSLNPDLIFNQCSSVGEAFDIAKMCTKVPTLKIDEAMAEKAVSIGSTIGVIATVASTMKPSCNLVKTKAQLSNKQVEVKEYLVDGALDILMKEKNVEKHNELVLSKINEACETCDVVVLAQGSMTAILPYLDNVKKPVLTSPRLAIERIKEMLYG